jgi:hypothetical protein
MLSGMSYVLGLDYVVFDVQVYAGIELLADGRRHWFQNVRSV